MRGDKRRGEERGEGKGRRWGVGAYLVRSPTFTTRSVSFDITPPNLIDNKQHQHYSPGGMAGKEREGRERGKGLTDPAHSYSA